ncbi:MAG: multiple ankyrin repeat single kh domain, partial [Gammaproteobacteria bacterium]|nr:multiple ankyrin repeat single kh domain [Gammaproteobacteria bacterium]
KLILSYIDLDTALKIAVKEDNPGLLKFLLEKGSDPNSVFDAAIIGVNSLGALEVLLQAPSADPNLALTIAINAENLTAAEFILTYVKDLNSLLKTAVEEDNPKAQRFLLEHKADPNSAFDAAINANNLGTLEVLLEAPGANPNLALCVAINANNLDAVKFLLQRGGVNPNWKDADGRSLLSIAIEKATNDSTAWGPVFFLLIHNPTVIVGLDEKALLNWVFSNNPSISQDILLHIFALYGLGIIKLNTLQSIVSDSDSPELRKLVTHFLKMGVSIYSDWTIPWKAAISSEDADLIEALLFYAKKQIKGQSDPHLPLLSGDDLCVALSMQGKSRDLFSLRFSENMIIFDPDWKNTHGYQAIRTAIEGGNLEQAVSLLDLGGEIEPPNNYPNPIPLLHIVANLVVESSAKYAKFELVRKLLECGADPRAQGPDGLPLKLEQLVIQFYGSKKKQWSELIFHYEKIKAYREVLQKRHSGDDAPLPPVNLGDNKQEWTKSLSEALQAIPSSKALWSQKATREIISLFLEEMAKSQDTLYLAMLAVATEKTFADAEVDIPKNIRPILIQLKAYGNLTDTPKIKQDEPLERKSSDAKEDELVEEEPFTRQNNAVLDELKKAIINGDSNGVLNVLNNRQMNQSLLDEALRLAVRTVHDEETVGAYYPKAPSIVRHLLEAGANPIQRRIEGDDSLLLYSVSNKKVAVSKLLLEYGAGEAIYSKYQSSKEIDIALSKAVETNQLEVVQNILKERPYLVKIQPGGISLLHTAIWNIQEPIPMVKCLLGCGFDPRTKGPRDEALDTTYKPILTQLGKSMEELVFEYEFSQIHPLSFFILNNYDPDFRKYKENLLQLCASNLLNFRPPRHKQDLLEKLKKATPSFAWTDKEKKKRDVLLLIQDKLIQYGGINLPAFAAAANKTLQYARIQASDEVLLALGELSAFVGGDLDVERDDELSGEARPGTSFILGELGEQKEEQKNEGSAEMSAVTPAKNALDLQIEMFHRKYQELCLEKDIDPEKSYSELPNQSKAELQRVQLKDLEELMKLTAPPSGLGALFLPAEPKSPFIQWLHGQIKEGYFDNHLKLVALKDQFQPGVPIEKEISSILDNLKAAAAPKPQVVQVVAGKALN